MKVNYREATKKDVKELTDLAVRSWKQFQPYLTNENWEKLHANLTDSNAFSELLSLSISFVAASDNGNIIGMAFLVPKGNPTDIYDADWSYIRYVTVDPEFGGNGIGRTLTLQCIERAKRTGEKVIALHTSEMMNKARHIYESLGFRILKEMDERLGKRYWLYKLDLKEEQ